MKNITENVIDVEQEFNAKELTKALNTKFNAEVIQYSTVRKYTQLFNEVAKEIDNLDELFEEDERKVRKYSQLDFYAFELVLKEKLNTNKNSKIKEIISDVYDVVYHDRRSVSSNDIALNKDFDEDYSISLIQKELKEHKIMMLEILKKLDEIQQENIELKEQLNVKNDIIEQLEDTSNVKDTEDLKTEVTETKKIKWFQKLFK